MKDYSLLKNQEKNPQVIAQNIWDVRKKYAEKIMDIMLNYDIPYEEQEKQISNIVVNGLVEDFGYMKGYAVLVDVKYQRDGDRIKRYYDEIASKEFECQWFND